MKSRLFLILVLLIIIIGVSYQFVAQTSSSVSPLIEFTFIPSYGSSLNLEGRVSNVDPDSYKVAVYIFIEGAGWWTKPYFAQPLTPIQSDST
jgi:hypothetical protein